jgi:hypothetical protein
MGGKCEMQIDSVQLPAYDLDDSDHREQRYHSLPWPKSYMPQPFS